jgi:hypothetical protein
MFHVEHWALLCAGGYKKDAGLGIGYWNWGMENEFRG